MSKRPARDDLFAIFADLPWYRHASSAGQREEVERRVKEIQVRTRKNIEQRKELAARVRAAIARRRR